MTPEGATLYVGGFGVSAELSNPGASTAKWTDYVSVGNAKVGMRVNAGGTLTWQYFKTDHLGSIVALTNGGGAMVQKLSYDAWGKRRNPNGTDDPAGSITSSTTRGFTGEEQLSVGGLVHLNGRVYDPLLARFTSADPTVTDPTNMQGWNRYSYVGNDPLTFTDPNGYSWFSDAFDSIGNFFSNAWNGVTSFFANNPIAQAVLQIGATIVLNVVLPGISLIADPILLGAAAAAGGAIIATGLSGGNLGQILKAGVIAGATTLAFAGLGYITPGAATLGEGFNPLNYAARVAGSAAIGCVSAVASGGACGSGAASAAVGAALSPITNSVFPNAKTNVGDLIGGTIVQATAGGLASVAGGGKFANGAITAAFQYLATIGVEKAGEEARNAPKELVAAGSEVLAFDNSDRSTLQCLKSCAYEQLGLDTLFGGAAIGAGQPILPKDVVLGGSSSGTSIASKYLSEWFPERLPFRVWAPTAVNPWAQSMVVGRIAGRWVPIVGWGIVGYDAAKIGYCTYQCAAK